MSSGDISIAKSSIAILIYDDNMNKFHIHLHFAKCVLDKYLKKVYFIGYTKLLKNAFRNVTERHQEL